MIYMRYLDTQIIDAYFSDAFIYTSWKYLILSEVCAFLTIMA